MKRIKVLKAFFVTWLFVLYIVYANYELLATFFMATVIFSSAILGLLAVGTLYQIISGYGIVMLGGTFGALAYKKTGYEFYLRKIDSILPANIAHMLSSRKSQQNMLFTQDESRSIIDWLESKFHKQKLYINFFINTAMLIGLLGTFVGLVEAIDHMGQIILSLNDSVDIRQVMQDFSGPISGMAIGFGASLFGVVAAVILGVNGYILFRYQDILIDGIEDWLKDRIIDTVPENMKGVSFAATNLPEQRKSFMDIFLEQMQNFTAQISKLSSSGDNTQKMADSLESIRLLLENDRTRVQELAAAEAKKDVELRELLGKIVELEERSGQDRVVQRQSIEVLMENQRVLFEQNIQKLSLLQDSLTGVDKKLEAIISVATALVEQNSSNAKESHKIYSEFLGTMQNVDLSLSKEMAVISSFYESQESIGQKMLKAMNSLASAMGEIDRKTSGFSGKTVEELGRIREELVSALSLVEAGIKVNSSSVKELLRSNEGVVAVQKEQAHKMVSAINDVNDSLSELKLLGSVLEGVFAIREVVETTNQDMNSNHKNGISRQLEIQDRMIREFDKRINETRDELNGMSKTIKNIERLLSDGALRGGVGSSESKKGFFGSLFSKK